MSRVMLASDIDRTIARIGKIASLAARPGTAGEGAAARARLYDLSLDIGLTYGCTNGVYDVLAAVPALAADPVLLALAWNAVCDADTLLARRAEALALVEQLTTFVVTPTVLDLAECFAVEV